MKIDARATHAKVKGAYITVSNYCRKKGFHRRVYYAVVASGCGSKGWLAPRSEAILEALRDEGLLVEVEESVDEAVNGGGPHVGTLER